MLHIFLIHDFTITANQWPGKVLEKRKIFCY